MLALTLAGGAGAGSGCAALDASIEAPPVTAPLQVQIDGLRFLALRTQRLLTVTQMRSRGWECRDEAATPLHVACTRPGAAGSTVVLSFADEILDSVRAPVPVGFADPRARFEDLFESGRRTWSQASVERTEVVSVARFLPGDGTSIELRLYIGADAIEKIHFGPARHPADEPRYLRLSRR